MNWTCCFGAKKMERYSSKCAIDYIKEYKA